MGGLTLGFIFPSSRLYWTTFSDPRSDISFCRASCTVRGQNLFFTRPPSLAQFHIQTWPSALVRARLQQVACVDLVLEFDLDL